MDTIAERLAYSRKQRNMTQKHLADAIGVTRVSISNIELGISSGVRAKTLFDIARVLKKNPEWLLDGKEPEDADVVKSIAEPAPFYPNVEPGPAIEQKCPLISWVQAGAFTAIQEFPEQEYTYYPCPSRCGPRTYILEVRGDSMLPRFEEGDLIYVDPDIVEPAHGKFVIAQMEDSPEATFKQLQVIDNKKLLKALNPSYPPELRYIQINGNCRLIGTVVAHVRPV